MIYLDNASTSFLKPQGVYEAVDRTLRGGAGNPGRGANRVSMEAAKIIYSTRKSLADLFGVNQPEHVILKSSVTESINTVLLSLLKPGDHVISSVMEHNSVLRPLEKLRLDGVITYDLLPCSHDGSIDISRIRDLEKENTKAVILSHASNLTGTIQPIGEVRSKLRNKGIFIILDAAQSAGYIPVRLYEMDVDVIAFTGHKGLLGPQGTGGFVLNDRINEVLNPIFTGGTGSDSLSLVQPLYLPDKFEAGTHNLPGIAGLGAGVRFILERQPDMILKYIINISELLLSALSDMTSIHLIGLPGTQNRLPNFCLSFDHYTPSEAGFVLENQFSVITRTGYHCAPLAHKALGTEKTGALRISFGHFTTMDEVEELIVALKYLDEVKNGD